MSGSTIKDIANAAGVSHTTVSRALNNSPNIKEATRERIRELAREMNYRPNISAKRLVLNRSFDIALFFTSVRSGTSPSFFHQVYTGAEEVIEGRYKLVIQNIADIGEDAQFSRREYDGIIIVSQSESDDLFIESVIRSQIPAVLVNRRSKFELDTYLSCDREGAASAVRALLKSGHRDIAFIRGEEGFYNTQERYLGFMDGMRECGLDPESSLIGAGHNTIESGYREAAGILATRTPDAIFCSNDEMALGAMRAASEAGLSCPDQISICGIDGSRFAEFTTPSLSTVSRDIQAAVRQACSALIRRIEEPEAAQNEKVNEVRIPSLWIERESTAGQKKNR